jgi:predicted metalloprotease
MKTPRVAFAVAFSFLLASSACSVPAGQGPGSTPSPSASASATDPVSTPTSAPATSSTAPETATATPSYKAVVPPPDTSAPATAAPSPTTTQLPQQPAAGQGQQLRSTGGSAGSTATMASFMTTVMTDVDKYWTKVWQGAGYTEPYVNVIYPGPGEAVFTPCANRMTTDDDAFYCGTNDTIVISQVVATKIWNGEVKANTDPATGNLSGDFSVALAVAHEYAHNLQTELGIIPAPPAAELYPVYKTELHADCWAGVWANSAYYEGILEAGDIEEGIQATMLLGDNELNDPGHHGTPMQRHAAFIAGYNSGIPASCDSWLLDSY